MLRVLAFVLLLIASLMVLFEFTADRFGPTSFVYFGLTLWCLSGIWDHALTRRGSE